MTVATLLVIATAAVLAPLLYQRVLGGRDRVALARLSSMVAAGMLSVLLFPLAALGA